MVADTGEAVKFSFTSANDTSEEYLNNVTDAGEAQKSSNNSSKIRKKSKLFRDMPTRTRRDNLIRKPEVNLVTLSL